MYRIFKINGYCVNFDSGTDAAAFIECNPSAVEMSASEIESVFDGNEAWACPENTKVDADGNVTFSYSPKIKSYDELRQAAILEKWPIAQQLEAHSEASEDPPRLEKLNALLADIQSIKELYPKP